MRSLVALGVSENDMQVMIGIFDGLPRWLIKLLLP